MKPFFIFIISLVAGFSFHAATPDFPMHGDTQTFYDPIAKNLAAGSGFWMNGEPTARVAPIYPFLLSLIYRAGGGFDEMLILQIFILAGIAVLTYFIAKKFIGKNFAFLSALTVAAWPYLLLYSKLVLTETLFIFFSLFAVYAFLIFYEKPTKKPAILTGILFGLATLVRPVILLLPIWIVAGILVFSYFTKKNRKTWNLGYLALLLAFFALTLMPWTVRNFLQFGKLIPVTSGLGASVDRAYVTLDYTEGQQPFSRGEATLFDHVKSRIKNVYLFWNPGAQGSNAKLLLEQNQSFNLVFFVYKTVFVLMASLAVFALFVPSGRARLSFVILWLIIVYFWALHIMLYPYPRYTLPIIPLIIILAWSSLHYLYNQYRSTCSQQLPKL